MSKKYKIITLAFFFTGVIFSLLNMCIGNEVLEKIAILGFFGSIASVLSHGLTEQLYREPEQVNIQTDEHIVR